jgi:hypothetical protein
MAAYVTCFVLVLSFIFFEVLDVDGSDFGALARTATIKVDEPTPDVRRVPLQTPLAWHAAVASARESDDVLLVQRSAGATFTQTVAAPESHGASRVLLARALLADPAPSV